MFIPAMRSVAPTFLQISVLLASIAVWQQIFTSTYCVPDAGLGTGDTEKRHRPCPGGVHRPVEKSECQQPHSKAEGAVLEVDGYLQQGGSGKFLKKSGLSMLSIGRREGPSQLRELHEPQPRDLHGQALCTLVAGLNCPQTGPKY